MSRDFLRLFKDFCADFKDLFEDFLRFPNNMRLYCTAQSTHARYTSILQRHQRRHGFLKNEVISTYFVQCFVL